MNCDSTIDEMFGALIWDAKHHNWKGRGITATGFVFDLAVDTGASSMKWPVDDAKVDRTISTASRTTFLRLRDSEEQARQSFVAEFVPLYSEWNAESITEEVFLRRLKLELVEIFSSGEAEIFYRDDGMFGGHALIAHLDADGRFGRGEMFG